MVSARSQPGLESLVDEIRQAGGEATAVIADVADLEQVKAIADKTVATYGRLDTWVHSSATAVFGTFEQITPEEFKRVIDVNLMGQVYGAMAALPYLRLAEGGRFYFYLLYGRSARCRFKVPIPLLNMVLKGF